jgi:peptidoglycan-N-acetylglucosamine deacetylase
LPIRALLFLCALCVSVAFPVRAAPPPAPGDRLAPFSLPEAGGGSRAWQPGRVTVLSFVAFWCDTWKPQHERLEAARKSLAGLPVEFLTVSIDGRWAERGRERTPGTLLLDPGSAFSARLGVRTVPYTVVADARGQVRYAAQGIVRGETVRQVVRELVNGEEAPSAGAVYLTFDDFPAHEAKGAKGADEELLDLLRARGVPATFFCLGRNVLEAPETVRRAAREGHSLQLHSWDHRAEAPQLDRCVRALRETAGVRAALYRPPGDAEVRRLTGERLALPVVNPYDYTRPGEAELVRRVLLAAKPGSVILLHAGVAETRAALPRILDGLRRRGLTFRTLE